MFALQALTGLQRLTMAGCAGVGNGAVGALGALTSLRHLDLRWCTFGDKGERLECLGIDMLGRNPHALLPHKVSSSHMTHA